MERQITKEEAQTRLSEVEEKLAQINRRYTTLQGEISCLRGEVYMFPCGAGLIGVGEDKLKNLIARIQNDIRLREQELEKLREQRQALERLKAELEPSYTGTKKSEKGRTMARRLASCLKLRLRTVPLR